MVKGGSFDPLVGKTVRKKFGSGYGGSSSELWEGCVKGVEAPGKYQVYFKKDGSTVTMTSKDVTKALVVSGSVASSGASRSSDEDQEEDAAGEREEEEATPLVLRSGRPVTKGTKHPREPRALPCASAAGVLQNLRPVPLESIEVPRNTFKATWSALGAGWRVWAKSRRKAGKVTDHVDHFFEPPGCRGEGLRSLAQATLWNQVHGGPVIQRASSSRANKGVRDINNVSKEYARNANGSVICKDNPF